MRLGIRSTTIGRAARNFLRLGDSDLQLLDSEQREIASTEGILYRQPGTQTMDSITLTESDAGRVTQVASGQALVIRLIANHTTGYRWILASDPKGVLTQDGEPSYTPSSGAPGGGGVEAWSFSAKGSGQQELRFEYRRPWERDAKPERVLTYTVAVR